MRSLTAVIATLTLAFSFTTAHAQVPDHLKCYKIKDPVKLEAVVNLDSRQFGFEAGCQVKPAKMFCVPATKTLISAVDKATGLPITLLPITGPDPGDRVCYKVKCPEPFPPDTQVSDQFGTRTVTKFKAFMLCAPAVKGGVPATPTPTATTTSTLTPTPTPTATPPRFVENGDGTVTDNVTGLQWEKKTTTVGSGQNYADPHDVDNLYTWSAGGGGLTWPDGTAFTDFLIKLNSANSDIATLTGCFAGHCDWRLPTIAELVTIIDHDATGCGSGNPCIEPIFGPTNPNIYWSDTTLDGNQTWAWSVIFYNGYEWAYPKDFNNFCRAVRLAP